jgi:hypothetical protein
MGFEKSFLAVTELVKNFQANENYYLSPEYQEVDVRRDFIDKLFTAPGWDVYQLYGLTENEIKIVEESVE